MALPKILVNSASGSDSQASGAGPATALYGTGAVSAADGLTVDLSADAPDLSGVATDGSAVLYFADGAGTKNFVKITGVNNTTKVVNVANAVHASQTKSWAIGGKRASCFSATSKLMFDNNGGAGDLQPGWIVEMESGHSEGYSSRVDVRCAGSATGGRITLQGASGAATRPLLTASGGSDIVPRGNYLRFKDFDCYGGGTNAQIAFQDTSTGSEYIGLKIYGHAGGGIYNPGGPTHIINCEIYDCTFGISGSLQAGIIAGCHIHDLTDDAINYNGTISGLLIYGNVIHDIGGSGKDGIDLTQRRTDAYGSCRIIQNVIDSCSGAGIKYSGLSASMPSLSIINNSISNNTGIGISLVDAGADAIEIDSYMPTIRNNNTYNNTGGNFKLGGESAGDLTINIDDPHIDPAYTDSANDDFTSSALSDEGFPQTIPNY